MRFIQDVMEVRQEHLGRDPSRHRVQLRLWQLAFTERRIRIRILAVVLRA